MNDNVERIREICRYIEEHADEPPSLVELAAMANLSKFHFSRRFKAVVGVTPKAFADAARLRRFKGNLKAEASVVEAVYAAGYGSSSRVYETAARNLGMTPAQYRAGGRDVAISYAALETPAGLMLLGATDRGICFAQFGESEEQLAETLRREFPSADVAPMGAPAHPDFARWVRAIDEHLRGERPDLNLPLDLQATAFNLRVWKYLQTIPYGDVQSYGEVAAGIGRPTAVRAVGNAIGRNRVAVIVPCHRVIRESGALGGYRWGLERKRTLLDIERAHRRSTQ